MPASQDLRTSLIPALTAAAQSHSSHSSALNAKRLLGVIPDYQTVDPSDPGTPLTHAQKWSLALKETADPFNVANAFMTAAFSQADNQTPKYGEGGAAYAKRFGAAMGDMATQNLFSAGVLANLLHQDPRYFRLGPQASVIRRIGYSVSRVVITRQDSGRPAFNASGLGGMVLGIAASNAYYPSESVHGYVIAERLTTSLTGSVMGNLMSEFLPDIQKKFLGRFFHKNSHHG